MKKRTLATTLAALGMFALAPACGGDDDSNGDGDGDGDGTGGVVTGSGGGDGDGTGGVDGDGDGDTGGSVGDGDGDTGGSDGTGGDNIGGMGAMGGGGGMGGGNGDAIPSIGCDGCAVLHVPFSAEQTGTDFELDLGASSLVDMSSTVVTLRLVVVTDANAGGIQLYAKNGENQSYASNYSGWNDLTDFTGTSTADFQEITLDLSALAADADGFVKAETRFIGINVASGDAWDGAMFDDVYVFVDSITFSDGATDDLTFDTDSDGLAVNEFNEPVAGSEVLHE